MKLTEVLNKAVFRLGFEKSKPILDGKYLLKAMPGRFTYVPGKFVTETDQFRIEAYKGKTLVGWVNFENKGDHLEALDLVVTKEHRRKGIATEMYKFAKELGNDIKASDKQTSLGKAFWNDKS